MSIIREKIGITKNGETVTKYTMVNRDGMHVSVLDLGAVITEITVPDKDGNKQDIVLGYDTVAEYEVNAPGFGAVMGRCANRISGAEYTLNGKTYTLQKNDGENCLHGGYNRFEHFMYQAECIEDIECDSIVFSRVSKDMEQGFPGNLNYSITYTWNDANELMLEYQAVSDQDTVINMTNHCYFNLGIEEYRSGSVLDQEMQIFANAYTPVGAGLIPTGEIRSVEGTAQDFRKMHKIGDKISKASADDSTVAGYDHNFVLNKGEEDIRLAARYIDRESKRTMEVFTDCPGLQVYSSDQLDDMGKNNTYFGPFSGMCFESQNFPNAINQEGFPSPILRAGETYERTTVYRFGILEE